MYETLILRCLFMFLIITPGFEILQITRVLTEKSSFRNLLNNEMINTEFL